MIKIIKKEICDSRKDEYDIIFTDQILKSKKAIKVNNPKDLYYNLNKVSTDSNIALYFKKEKYLDNYYQLLYFYQNYIEKVNLFKKEIKKLNKSFDKSEDHRLVTDAIHKLQYMNCDGKYLRAFLITLGYQLKNDNVDYVIPLALAYETFQTSILIHDDIIDNSETRRGKKTIHEIYNEELKSNDNTPSSLAICIGDLGFYLTNSILFKKYKNDPQLIKILEYLNKVIINTIKGEIVDVYLPTLEKLNNKGRFTERDVMEISRLKTSWYTVVGPFCLGAIAANVSESKIKNYEKMLEPIGIAFQVRDDILGIFGSSDTTGKSNITDIEENKLTIMYSYLKLVKEKYYNEFIKYYGKEHVTEEDAEIVRDLIMRSGALDYAEDTIVELLNLSKEEIIKLKNKHVKDTLLGLMEYLRLREK